MPVIHSVYGGLQFVAFGGQLGDALLKRVAPRVQLLAQTLGALRAIPADALGCGIRDIVDSVPRKPRRAQKEFCE